MIHNHTDQLHLIHTRSLPPTHLRRTRCWDVWEFWCVWKPLWQAASAPPFPGKPHTQRLTPAHQWSGIRRGYKLG